MKNQVISCLLALCIAISPAGNSQAQSSVLVASNGEASFVSEAPLEIIMAKSKALKGAIDLSKNSFAFAVSMRSFEGFNSELQKEHFHENYLESELYPEARFSGKLVEAIDYQQNGIYQVRAKGLFSIHGVTVEQIIRGDINVNEHAIDINSTFSIRLEDYDIKVPRIVNEKIAPEVTIHMKIRFNR